MKINNKINGYTLNKGEITENRNLASGIFKITIDTAECQFTRPGQVALIEFNGKREAFPVCEYDGKRFSVAVNDDDEFAKELTAADMGTDALGLEMDSMLMRFRKTLS